MSLEDAIAVRLDIQQQKEDIEDADEKGNALKKVIEVATQLIGAAGLAATGIAQLVNSLQINRTISMR